MRSLLVSSLAVVSVASGAQAAISSFTDRPTYVAATTPTVNETFEGFTADAQFRTATVTANGFTLRQEGTDLAFRNTVDVFPFQQADNNGTKNASMFVDRTASGPGTSVRLAFPGTGARAFAADFHGVGDPATGEGLRLSVFAGDFLITQFVVPNTSTSNGLSFFGFALDESVRFSSILLSANTLAVGSAGEGFGMDNVAISVPEPTGIALAMAAIPMIARRRRA